MVVCLNLFFHPAELEHERKVLVAQPLRLKPSPQTPFLSTLGAWVGFNTSSLASIRPSLIRYEAGRPWVGLVSRVNATDVSSTSPAVNLIHQRMITPKYMFRGVVPDAVHTSCSFEWFQQRRLLVLEGFVFLRWDYCQFCRVLMRRVRAFPSSLRALS